MNFFPLLQYARKGAKFPGTTNLIVMKGGWRMGSARGETELREESYKATLMRTDEFENTN